jgi:hypothetical protein
VDDQAERSFKNRAIPRPNDPWKRKRAVRTALEVNREASNRGRNHSAKSRTI